MSYLDTDSLAIKMNRLQRWLDINKGNSTAVTHYFDRAFASVTVDPASTSPAASMNRNAMRLCGGRGLSATELDEMVQLFDAQAVERFFVWLNPGPGSEVVREWLNARDAIKVRWTQYPTMVHTGRITVQSSTMLEIRRVTRDDIESGKVTLIEDAAMDGFMQFIGRPGFSHFAAFEGDQPIATAILVQLEDLAYLSHARTAEPFRGRGAQTALIAARIAEAHRLGCTLIVSQTLTMLKGSYANLSRAGFEVAYETEVYECVRSSASSI
jgi:GNAT superfamily N-acetyltransferase